MKTKEQIDQFLKTKKFVSEEDFTLINSYCMTEHKIRLHVPSKYISGPDSIDCPSFINWLKNGFGGGDIVKWDNCIGLVCKSTLENVEIGLTISSEGSSFDKQIISNKILSSGSESDKARIYEALEAAGMEFGNPYLVISEKFIPTEGDLIHFTKHDGSFEGYGVVRLVDKHTGDIVLYCYLEKGGKIYYSMEEHIGNIKDFKFSPFKAADYPRKLMETELEKVGKSWNHSLKRIEPINMKVAVGEKYWYITDKMTVTSDIDNGKITAHKRYLAANYFKNESDAYRILSEEVELRRNFLAEPQQV